MRSPCLKNVKGHFKIPAVSEQLLKERLKKSDNIKFTNNFCSLKVNGSTLTYVIFYKAKYINVTGISSVALLDESPYILAQILKLPYTLLFDVKCEVDNMTFSGTFGKCLNLSEIARKLQAKNFTLRYNPTVFPGLYIKIPPRGSILVFISGKYSIIGVTCKNQAQEIVTIVQNVMLS